MFYFFRFALPLVFGIGAFIYLWFVNDHGLKLQMKIGVVVFAFAAGFYGPNLYLENLISKRRTSIMRAFPGRLDMMLICVESGMSIEHGVRARRRRDRHGVGGTCRRTGADDRGTLLSAERRHGLLQPGRSHQPSRA